MTSFLNSLFSRAKELFERLRLIAEEIINRIESWATRIREHRAYVEQVENSSPTYNPEEVDIRVAEELKRSIDEIAPEGLITHLQNMSTEDRIYFIEQQLLPLIASKMSISYDRLEWLEDNKCLCGYYCYQRREIGLNMAFISSDDKRLLTVLVNTILHECKHARQRAAVEGVYLGYSQQTIDEWRLNFDNYISPNESDEGYIKQPVEFDASMFANSIIDENTIFENNQL